MHKVDSFWLRRTKCRFSSDPWMQPFFFVIDSRCRKSKVRAAHSGGFVKRKLFVLLLNLLLVLPISAQRTSHSTGTTRHSTTTTSKPKSSNRSAYYTNRSGHRVHRPMQSATVPAGATAQCADGSYSFSEHRRGTCSHHGGVSRWLVH